VQLNEARSKGADALRRLKECKTALENRDKEKSYFQRRCDSLQQRIVSLEAEMRLAGIQPSGAGAINMTDADILTPALAGNTTFNALANTGFMSSTTAPMSAAKLASTARSHNVPVTSWDDLVTRVRTLEAQLETAQAARDQTDAALKAEVRAGEEGRSYITVLERTLQNRALELGLGPDAARLITEAARRQGELEMLRRDCSSKDERIRALETHVKEANARKAMAEPSTPIKGSSTAEVSVFSPHLGAISNKSHQAAPAPDAALVARLEAEKGALLDYIAELRDTSTTSGAQLESLIQQKRIMEGELERIKSDSAANIKRAADFESRATAATRELAEARVTAAAAEARLSECKERTEKLENTLKQRDSEVAELREVQVCTHYCM
jgi:hypothetical protein